MIFMWGVILALVGWAMVEIVKAGEREDAEITTLGALFGLVGMLLSAGGTLAAALSVLVALSRILP